jgi:tRNA (cmo5U34)-methyltransferase
VDRKDRLYDAEITQPEDFVFDDRVVRVFPDMINRSIPAYGQLVPMIGMLARRYATPNSNIYDLGCSLGAVSMAAGSAVSKTGVRIFAIDNSADMVRRLRSILQAESAAPPVPIEVVRQDIRDTPIENASVVVLNFTLQFIPPEDRQRLVDRIAAGLNEGGVLLVSEKLRFDDPGEHALLTEWHHDFKRAQGYSELEISRKRDALENVMKPDSLSQHRARLAQAGFSRVVRWFQGFNFVSLAAFK